MADKTGKHYETLTQVVFQIILNDTEVKNIEVRRNIRLQGITRKHQIDVHWKFELGGVTHEAIVQAKDWKKPISQLHLLAFESILRDLPGQPRGICVTRSTFQSGARDFALKHGILLYELKEFQEPSVSITAGGWGRVQVVALPLKSVIAVAGELSDGPPPTMLGFKWQSFTPVYTKILFNTSQEWFHENYPGLDVSSPELRFAAVHPHQRLFFDENKQLVGNLSNVTEPILATMKRDGLLETEVVHTFDPPVFVETGNPMIPHVLAHAVNVAIRIQVGEEVVKGSSSKLSRLVLHQLNSDQKMWFGATEKTMEILAKPRRALPKRKPRKSH